MPRRTDIRKIIVIGSGPIVIGQACEFDYSGTQACTVLRREGFEVCLVNPNPATIMTDPEFADRTYIEPLTPASVLQILERERPDALLPTLGGQTGLNVSVALAESGDLGRLGVRMLGASLEAIHKAEDRSGFQRAMVEAGLDVPRSGIARSVEEAVSLGTALGFPVIVRPSFTLGGGGSGFADDRAELADVAARSLAASPVSEVLIEESIAGWKEFELEVMRDGADNAVIVCSIENLDPMGVHTGDSITVAPQQTLSDREYQRMRDTAIAVLRVIGVETGGSNVQFAVDPSTGRQVLIEMNPRVSRSSALASKATGFPIAKIAALVAVGYRLDEITNDITGETPAAFEPTLDYVVVKIPRFAFEKFPAADTALGSTMRSVGEVMAIGSTFKEALGKAWRGLERPASDRTWGGADLASLTAPGDPSMADVARPSEHRLHLVAARLASGETIEAVAAASRIDPWFVDQIAQVVEGARELIGRPLEEIQTDELRHAKRLGLSDERIGELTDRSAGAVRARREALGVIPVFKTVDTCAGEFAARTPYHYSTYQEETETVEADQPRVVILGAGPNRIGQGIEFDYACVHAAFALEEAGFASVMINSNPETVSTDYDTASRLYFEPLAAEDVLAVCRAERPVGVIAQLGGQTPLELARTLRDEGVPIVGTSPEAIDLAEDRGRFAALLQELEIPAPPHGEARTMSEARDVAARIGYPVVVRPSYVLGGRAMEIVYDDEELERFVGMAAEASPEHPVLIDRFLEGAIEVDVDAVCDGEGDVFIGAVMEHIEEAGVHSGDSSCQIPPATLSDDELDLIEDITSRIARRLGVIGLLNLQLAVKDERIWVLEANPRASRTVPFVGKVIGVSLARVATFVLVGRTIADMRADGIVPADRYHYRHLPSTSVKAAVLPFGRFPGVDTILGPEMRSTGEVMGIDVDSGMALAKAMVAAGHALPTTGTVFVSVANRDKRSIVFPAKRLADLGFRILATRGTAGVLQRAGIPVAMVAKVSEDADNVAGLIRAGVVDLVINTPFGRAPRTDGSLIRTAAAAAGVPCITTLPGAFAALRGIEALRGEPTIPISIQEHHAAGREGAIQVRLTFDEAADVAGAPA
ncbi:MAG TPA: carbamoyl-phosphate synthase large subunit [Actinomycetota bacterium]|jgi:carbamoyl-phosphate synthase large subunit|nr:carbamoyl-phosphate synthase large subunit [Actinomycetota bacterium]